MKYLNSATITVFAKPNEEDIAATRKALLDLVPLSLEEEKIELKEERATGFNEQPIRILSITLTKTAHTNTFLKKLLTLLSKADKQMLIEQRESRLDNELTFFIRLDKDRWLASREAEVTDSGKCFHIKLNLAAFPARRPDALELVEKIFKPESDR
jgi:RNA binding exosome subunit